MKRETFIPVRSLDYVFKTGKNAGKSLNRVIEDDPDTIMFLIKSKYIKVDLDSLRHLKTYYDIKYNADIDITTNFEY